MMKRSTVAILAGLWLAATFSSAPAQAQRTEGWRFFQTGDFSISPMLLGPAIYTGSGSATLFALQTDFDYHAWGPAAIGGLFNLGFRGGGVALQMGPQFKYKFKIGQTPHVPYVRAAIPLTLTINGSTGVLLGLVQFGGGYRYFFHRMVGAGIDLAFQPSVLLSPGTDFVFIISITFGVEVKF